MGAVFLRRAGADAPLAALALQKSRQEGRQTSTGFTQRVTCNLVRQKSLGSESSSSRRGTVHSTVGGGGRCGVREAARSTLHRRFSLCKGCVGHRSCCPGGERHLRLPETCFSTLPWVSSAPVPVTFECPATEMLLPRLQEACAPGCSHPPCLTPTGGESAGHPSRLAAALPGFSFYQCKAKSGLFPN